MAALAILVEWNWTIEVTLSASFETWAIFLTAGGFKVGEFGLGIEDFSLTAVDHLPIGLINIVEPVVLGQL